MSRKFALLAGASFLMISTSVFAQEAAADQAAAEENTGGLEEIIVTAQKREQNLQNVPVAVTALSAEAIENSRIADFSDLTRAAPSLTITQTTSSPNNSIVLRGIGTFAFSTGVEPSVAVIIDDMPVVQQAQAFDNLADLQRIEVLKGPQGTLFGKSSSAGVVNIVTNDPDRDFVGKLSATAATDGDVRLEGVVSIPLGDTSGVRVTGFYHNFPGNVQNLTSNTSLNDQENYGVRAKFKTELGNSLTFATGWPSLAFFRGLLGATEAAAIPAGTKTVSEWFPPKERPLATSAFQMGTSVGNMIAPPLVAFCILFWGWESGFIITGALSLVWAGLWYWGYRSPAEHKKLGEAERAYIEEGRAGDVQGKPATRKEVLKSRSFWAIAIPRFLAEPAWQTFNFFIPLYLVAVWQLDLKSIALWAWLPFLAADFGSLAAGLLPTWLMKKGANLITSRKITMTIGALCMIGPACIGLAGSPGVAIALFCVGGFAHQMLNGALLTLCSDVFDTKTVGTASGMTGTIAWTGGMLFTFLIGKSADVYGYDPLFVALAALDLVGAVVLWVLLRGGSGRLSHRLEGQDLE